VAALAAAIGGVAFGGGRLFQYVSFDYLWWVAAAYFMVRLHASGDPRWCLAIGAAIGLGMLTKYAMMFLTAGIATGFLLTPARRFLRSPWLWCGIALALVIFLPNLLWQMRHHFVSLDFLKSIHARDISIVASGSETAPFATRTFLCVTACGSLGPSSGAQKTHQVSQSTRTFKRSQRYRCPR
jgi:4-amino-4-deoxy-L-arabinose transferase-like glycosyltransferase